MSRLIEGLVVVDAKYFTTGDAGAQPPDLWRKIARPDVSKHRECREAMKIRHTHAYRWPVNLRAFPSDREKDRRVCERAKVIRVVRIFPQVVGVHHHVLSKRLLKAGVELVALAGTNWLLQARAADYVHNDRVTRP